MFSNVSSNATGITLAPQYFFTRLQEFYFIIIRINNVEITLSFVPGWWLNSAFQHFVTNRFRNWWVGRRNHFRVERSSQTNATNAKDTPEVSTMNDSFRMSIVNAMFSPIWTELSTGVTTLKLLVYSNAKITCKKVIKSLF